LKPHLANSAADEPLPRQTKAAGLHVLTLTPFFPSLENEVGGCFVKEPLDALAGHGITSTVIAVSPIYNHRQHSNPAAPAEWLRYLQIPGTIGLSIAGRFLHSRLSRKVRQLHSKRPIDVIHAHAALPCGHAASLLALRLKIPYIVTVHGLDVFNTCFLTGAPAEWRRRASIVVYRDASAVVCVSRKVQQILKDGMSDGASAGVRADVRSTVVYNGTDTELFSPTLDDHRSNNAKATAAPPPEILVVGNLIPSKGQELILRAIHRLADEFPLLQCRIIGEGPDHARLEALAADLNLRDRIHFLGRQNRLAVADALRRCTVFALPSRNEGLGCVYLEAMAGAKPAIGCRGQGIEEIIEHQKNGWLISPDNPDELTQTLAALLRSPDLCAQVGLAARQTILNGLTLSHQAQELATLYRLAASNRAL
jgi:teichuronic acid biosynthesis glycosyltransferase TuaC